MSSSYGAVAECHAPGDDEEKLFPTDLNDSQLNSSAKRWGAVLPRAVGVISLILALSGLAVMADVWRDLKNTALNTGYFSETVVTSASDIIVTSVANEYGIWDSLEMFPYPFFVESFLVEPYKETTITLTDPTVGCAYDWSMTKNNADTVDSSGKSVDGTIVVTLSSVGEYVFTVSEGCGHVSTSGRQLSQTVWVKYVRRELSTLTDNDRTAFLDAFHTLWTVSTTEGQALYGDRYKSVNYFATLHNDGGGNNVCDEFHGGYGFLNNHMYLSAYLEQSLQLVDPSVALHYMEYSKYFESDGFTKHLNNQLDGGSWTEILTANFFGASDPFTGRIIDGRWESAEVPYLTPDFFTNEGVDPDHTFFPTEEDEWIGKGPAHLSSPYGLLRSPWNYNPSPFIARFGNVFGINDTDTMGASRNDVFKFHMGVGCTNYELFFNYVKKKALQVYLISMEDDTHGLFHFTLGGVGGDQADATAAVLQDTYQFTASNLAALSVSAQHFFKKHLALSQDDPVNCTTNPWQDNKLMTRAMPGQTNGPQCDFSDRYYESNDTMADLITYFFNYDPDTDDSIIARVSALSLDDQKACMKIIGNMFPIDGDLAGSGAAMDPLFWVAHGAMERTFHKSVFSGIFTDMLYTKSGHCSGHSATEAKFWLTGLYFTDETIKVEELDNAELTAILDPTSVQYRDLVNFVYDTGSYSWCEGSDAWFA